MFYTRTSFRLIVLFTLCFIVSLPSTSVTAQQEVEISDNVADSEFARLAQRLQTELYYAGAWIEHVPEHRFYVGFTSSDYQERLEPYLSGMTYADLVVPLQREYTLSELREARRLAGNLLAQKFMAGEISYYRQNLSQSENRVVITTSEPDMVRSIIESDDTLVSFQDMVTYVYSENAAVSPQPGVDTNTYLFLPIISK